MTIKLAVIITAIITSILAYGAHRLDVYYIDSVHEKELQAQKDADDKQCKKDKVITKTVGDDYDKKDKARDDQLAADKLREPAKCIMPVAKPTIKHNAPAKPSVNAGSYGISTEWLYDYAGEAEGYRIQVEALQSFINQVWAEQGQ